ncbi:MAG: NADPH:quinone oxidoreductase family protein [Myxococcota bacterium]|nr:NADPH:quinone oxidoreductase family protein [Myxococcota bacterium]
MKAVACNELGSIDQLVLEEQPEPVLAPGQVRIQVEAAGINFVDILFVGGQYQIRPEPPFVPGSEVAGRVTDVADDVDTFSVGDRVVAMTGLGGYAEVACARADNTLAIPDALDSARAAGVLQSYATALYALRWRTKIAPGETVLVLGGAGGVGLAAIDVARASGARVLAAASTEAKREACLAAGAEAVIDYTQEDLKTRSRELSEGGVDVVFDPVGGAYSEPALRALRWGGRFLVIGFAAGEIPKIPLNLALLNRRSILGVDWGAFTGRDRDGHRRLLSELGEGLRSGELSPVEPQRYPLDRAIDALRDLSERRVVGKAVLVPEAP